MRGPTALALAGAAAAVAVLGCAPTPGGVARRGDSPAPPYRWSLPPGFPVPRVPADNPMSDAKVELGRRLFHDPLLSGDGNYACASCHAQARAFTDGRARALGARGDRLPRGAMSLTNVAYNASFGWHDPDLRSLEDQVRVPLLNEHPIELGLAGREREVLDRIAGSRDYAERFPAAFPGEGRVTLESVARALAAFERTLISGASAYDRRVFMDERDAMTPAARRGMRLFFSERLGCGGCHRGFNLSGPVVFRGSADAEPELHDTGSGRFRAPTLRNIALTAPYMHDGRLATLGEVLDFYSAGGHAARGFELARDERSDVGAFLDSLTDTRFASDPRFASPF